jgi:L-ascorbate metabolism protein UlaG (beta-lactamase superfamily)
MTMPMSNKRMKLSCAAATMIAGIAALCVAGCAVPKIAPGALPVSDHFDGRRFFNPDGEQGTGGEAHKKAFALIKQEVHPPHRSWPRSVPVTLSKPPVRVAGEAMKVTWIGHSTVLIQTQGLNILLDPVWAERPSPVGFAGVRRVRAPGVRLADLPPIDVILLSHDHYDHLDTATMARLWRRDRPTIVTGLENDRLLARYGIKARALDWGGRLTLRPGIEVILNRAHHWSAHGLGDHDRSLWTGFTVTLPGGNLYYAGDTGRGDMRWALEAAALGPVRLAILPIGAYQFDGEPTGNHIGPEDAVTAFEQLGAAYALGVHWGTFELTSETIDEPRERLATALAAAHLAPERFRTTEAGEAWDIAER